MTTAYWWLLRILGRFFGRRARRCLRPLWRGVALGRRARGLRPWRIARRARTIVTRLLAWRRGFSWRRRVRPGCLTTRAVRRTGLRRSIRVAGTTGLLGALGRWSTVATRRRVRTPLRGRIRRAFGTSFRLTPDPVGATLRTTL